ncbi:uncharacterized protein V1478_015797 [Vespula squamosa]|uniref:Regulatory protein zeste n=1 Tax=Vespula squamosa TaxID=30214 RepID=A0ABD2A2B4_VESSQ
MDPASTLPSSSRSATRTSDQFWSEEEDIYLFILIKNRYEIVEPEFSEDTKEQLWIDVRKRLNKKYKTDRDMNCIKERWEKLKNLAKLDIYTFLSKIKQKSSKITSYRPSHFNLQIWKLLKPHKRKEDECDDAIEYTAYMSDLEIPHNINILLDNLIRISDIIFDPNFIRSSSSSSNGSSERSRSLSPPRSATPPGIYRSSRSKSAQSRFSSYMTYDDLTRLYDEDNEEGATSRNKKTRSMSAELKSSTSTESVGTLVGDKQRQLSDLSLTMESDLRDVSSSLPDDRCLKVRGSDRNREEPSGAIDDVERVIPGSSSTRIEPSRTEPSRTESTQHGAQSLHNKDKWAKIKESNIKTSDDSREGRAPLRVRWAEILEQFDEAQSPQPNEKVKAVKMIESNVISSDDKGGKKPTVRWSDQIHRSAAQWFHASDKWKKLKESQTTPMDSGGEEKATEVSSRKEPSRQSVDIFEPSQRWIRLRDSSMKQKYSSASEDEGKELRSSSESPKIKPIPSSAPQPIPFSDKRYRGQEYDMRMRDDNEIRRFQRVHWKEPIQSSGDNNNNNNNNFNNDYNSNNDNNSNCSQIQSLYHSERWIRITESDKSTSDESGEERKTHTIWKNDPLHQSDVPPFYPADKWIQSRDSDIRIEDSSESGDDARGLGVPSEPRIDSALHSDRWIRLRETDLMVEDSSGSNDETIREERVISDSPRIDPRLHGVKPFLPSDRWIRLRETDLMVEDSSGSNDETIREERVTSDPPRIDPRLHGVKPFLPSDRWVRLRETDLMVEDSSGSNDETIREERVTSDPPRIDPRLHGVKPFLPSDRWIRLRESDIILGDSSESSDESVREIRASSELPRIDPRLHGDDRWIRYKESDVRTGDYSRERTMPTASRVETIYRSNDSRRSEAWLTIRAPDGTIEAIPMGTPNVETEVKSSRESLPTQAHVQPYYPESWLRIRDSIMRERGFPVRSVDSDIEERPSRLLPNPPTVQPYYPETWFRVREEAIAERNVPVKPRDSDIEVRESARTLPSLPHVQSHYSVPRARIREPVIMERDILASPADSDIEIRPSARTLPSQSNVSEPVIAERNIPARPAGSNIEIRPSARTLLSQPHVQPYYPIPRTRIREPVPRERIFSMSSDIEMRPLARTLSRRPRVLPHYEESWVGMRMPSTRERNFLLRSAISDPDIRSSSSTISTPQSVLPDYGNNRVILREPAIREGLPMRSTGVPAESRPLTRSETDRYNVYLNRLREIIIEEEEYYRSSSEFTAEENIRRLQILRIRERELFIRESQYLEEQIHMQRLENNLETAQMRKRVALSEYKLAELKELMLELNINDRSQVRMTSEPGSGANRGGRAGAIREAGGAFGQMEIAHEDQYFYNQQREQIRKLREGIRDEIAFHEEQIRRHQEAIERHNARMAEMRSTEK